MTFNEDFQIPMRSPVSKPPTSCKCDICGKFRKEKDCVLQEEVCGDGFELDQYLECKYCMSISDKETYFPNEVVN